jgi:intein/homing endonuclease
MVGADVAEAEGITGRGVKVAVLDTGRDAVSYQLRMGEVVESTVTGQPVGQDEHGHGQHVAATIGGQPFSHPFGLLKGVAPGVELIHVKVLGYGLGFGCLVGSTWILTKKGYRKIYEIRPGETLINFNVTKVCFEEDTVVRVFKRRRSPSERLLKIKTDEGHVIIATEDHPFWTDAGWKRAGELRVGDHLIAYPTPEEYRRGCYGRFLASQARRPITAGQPHTEDSRAKISHGVKTARAFGLHPRYERRKPPTPKTEEARRRQMENLKKGGEWHRGKPKPDSVRPTDPTIISIRQLKNTPYVYDIETEKNHTLIANGLVVHNSMSDILAGMQRAKELGAKVVNMSLGGKDTDDPEAPEFRAVKQLTEAGIIVCIAAGNSGPDPKTIGSPGSAPDALTVGAIDMRGNLASFSSRGPTRLGAVKPDCIAPGVNVLSEAAGLIATYRAVDLLKAAAISGCLAKGTLVYTADGPKPIEEVETGDRVFSFADGTLRPTVVKAVIPQKRRTVYEVCVGGLQRHGGARWRIRATDNHPFLVMPGRPGRWAPAPEWVQVRDLRPQDNIVMAIRLPVEPVGDLEEVIDEDLARFLGYFMADGWVSVKKRNSMVAIPAGSAIDEAYALLFERLFGVPMRENKPPVWRYIYSKRLALALKLLGLGEEHRTIGLPGWVFHLSEEKRRAFLQGFLEGDGHRLRKAHTEYGTCVVELASRRAVEGLAALAHYSGVRAAQIRTRTRLVKPPGMKEPRNMTTYCLSLNLNPYQDGRSYTRWVKSLDGRFLVVRPVVSVTPVAEEETYDLSIEGADNFIAQGFVAHNTSMATPHAAGVVALAVELARRRGVELTTPMVKAALARFGKPKDNETGWGLITYPLLKRFIEGL